MNTGNLTPAVFTLYLPVMEFVCYSERIEGTVSKYPGVLLATTILTLLPSAVNLLSRDRNLPYHPT